MRQWTMRVYTWGLTALAFAVLAGGCGVSPELKAKLDAAIEKEKQLVTTVLSLTDQLNQLDADYKAGKLDSATFGEVKERLTAQLNQVREDALNAKLSRLEVQVQAKEEGANGWSIAGAVILNLALRLVGVPGFASSGGGNLVTLGKKLTTNGEAQ